MIEDDVYIGRNAFLTAIDAIRIGSGSVLSDSVYITDENHGMHPDRGLIMQQPLESKGPVSIGRHCFIGFRAAILPGVALGRPLHCGSELDCDEVLPEFLHVGIEARQPVSSKKYSPELGEWITPSSDG